MTEFSNILKECRNKIGLTQYAIAKNMNISRMDKQIINDSQGCHKCIYSKMNGMDLICTEWQEVIEDDKCLCSCYEEKSDE